MAFYMISFCGAQRCFFPQENFPKFKDKILCLSLKHIKSLELYHSKQKKKEGFALPLENYTKTFKNQNLNYFLLETLT